ncbi:MAG TPA: hypothetical protein VH120_12930 [Gemmataceae bacterium]|nr:hypothetical protein [Gemmataceae bacterium]
MVSHKSQAFHRPATVGPLLVTLLAVGSWLGGDRPAQGQAPVAAGQSPPPARPNPANPDKPRQRAAEQPKKADEPDRKPPAAAQPNAEPRPIGLTPAEIQARLRPDATPLPPEAPGSRIELGMRLDLIMKDGANQYSGALVDFDGTTILLQTIPLPGARPSMFDLANVAAVQTDFGVFAYSPRTGRVVPAMTYYQLNKSNGYFERTTAGDAFLADNAKIVGPTNSALAIYGLAHDGSWSIGLPVPFSDSPEVIPAGNFQRILTSQGVHSYDRAAKDYSYQSYSQIGEAAQAERDAAGQAYYQRQRDRDVQNYQLQTERVRALSGDSSGSSGLSIYSNGSYGPLSYGYTGGAGNGDRWLPHPPLHRGGPGGPYAPYGMRANPAFPSTRPMLPPHR